MHGGVARPAPHGVAVALPRRQRQIVLVEPQQRLSRAAQLLDLVEDQPDRLLHPPVRVLLQPVARLDEAGRRADDELAAPRLLVASRQRALAQKVELVLVEAALQPEQEAVVALARRVHRVLVDQQRVDHAAHLDQLLPVAAVPCKARDLARRHGADLAETDLRHHALEARAGDGARGGPAQVLVDDLDLREAESLQPPRHGVLQGAALAVVHDLVGRGLPDIEHRLAAQMLWPDLLRHHDRPPPDRGDRARGPASAGPSARSPSGVSGWEARTMSARPPDRCFPPGRTDRADPIRSRACDAHRVDLAWVSPRSWSSETHPARDAGALPSASDTSDARADSVARSTWPRSSTTRIPAQTTRSNIQSGTSCQTPGTAPSRAHRARAMPCLLYDIADPDKAAAPGMPPIKHPAGAGPMGGLALSCTTSITSTQQPGIPAAGPGDGRLAKLAARLRYVPPTTQLGRETGNALTFQLYRSLGADRQGCPRWCLRSAQPLQVCGSQSFARRARPE